MTSSSANASLDAEVRLELIEAPSLIEMKRSSGSFKGVDPKKEGEFESTEGLLDRKEGETVQVSVAHLRRKSRWLKLKNTVKVAHAMSGHVKIRNRSQHSRGGGGTLSREDSFMKRFSTRQNHSSSVHHRNHQIHPNSSSTPSHTRLAKSFSSSSGSRLRHRDDSNHTSDNDADVVSGNTSAASEADRIALEVKDETCYDRSRCLFPVIQPDGCFLFYWLALLTSAILYNLWTPIAREAFPELNQACPAAWLVADIICDVIYLADVAVQFRTGYLERGLIVYDGRKLARNYTRSRHFLLDVLSLTPLDLLQIYFSSHPILRFMRFMKCYRVYRFVYMVETRTAYPNLWRVVNLSHVLFLGCHWFAAFYYLISMAENFDTKWSYPTPVGNYSSVAQKYLRSLYWSTLTLTTIGDLTPPETNWEHVFTIVSYLIGVFVFATIVGQVGNVITNRNASRQEFEKLLDGAKAYMRHHSVPEEMQRHVQRWYDYAWSRGCMNGGGDINALGLLPDKLKTELALHVNLETLKKVTIFHECEPEFLHDLVLKMRTYIFTPGDLICRKGEVAREMFIIADGLLEVISETGEILSKMSAGDFFGEIGILNMDGGVNKRTADVRSVGYSELIVLSRDDVLSALRDHPEAEALIKEYGHRRLHELGARRKKNLNPEAGVPAVNQLIGSIVGLKKSLAADQGRCSIPNNGNRKGADVSSRRETANPIQSGNVSPHEKLHQTTTTATADAMNRNSVHQPRDGEAEQVPSPGKESSRKSSSTGSKEENEGNDQSGKDPDRSPTECSLPKTVTTDTLVSNGSSSVTCAAAELPATCETPLLVSLQQLQQQIQQNDSGPFHFLREDRSKSLSDASRQNRKSSLLANQSLPFRSRDSAASFPAETDACQGAASLERNVLPPPTRMESIPSAAEAQEINDFSVEELSSTIAACVQNFFESRLNELRARVKHLEADNLAKSEQIETLNSMLEQKMKEVKKETGEAS